MHSQPHAPMPVEAESLLQRIQSFLRAQHILVLRQLKVEVSGDTVVIHGNVRTYYERQVGVECCKRVAGVRKVIDLIKVGASRKWPLSEGSRRH